MVSTLTFQSNIDGLNKIYSLEENDLGSVFFEFNNKTKMKIACINVSKSWELTKDNRLPNQANEQLCFGFTVKASEIAHAKIHSIHELIGRVNYWMGGGNILEEDKPIIVTSIKSDELKKQMYEMPVKQYGPYKQDGKTYAALYPQTWND